MRNGNKLFLLLLYQQQYCSYPTYEEWKQTCSTIYLFPVAFVLILPMRNGNAIYTEMPLKQHLCSYPTYEEWKLGWKILRIWSKKCSYPTYEEWKPFLPFLQFLNDSVLILPMRNGNLEKAKDIKTWLSVLILPMRNGNKQPHVWAAPSNLCSYPTYEEWKLATFIEKFRTSTTVLILPMRNGNGIDVSIIEQNIISSYPTYEEWKQFKEEM